MTEQNQFLAFIARLCLVLLFPFSALNKIFDYQAAMTQAAHGWIPLAPSAAAVLLVLGGTLEVVGPVCILFGFYRRQAALLFIFYGSPQRFCSTTSGAFHSIATSGTIIFGHF